MIKKLIFSPKKKFENLPDETDVEFLTVVMPIELISDSGDHIFALTTETTFQIYVPK